MYRKKRTKTKIAIVVIMAMLMQVTGLSFDVFANNDSFKVIEKEFKDGKAYVDWRFKVDLDNRLDDDFTIDLGLTTKSPIKDEDLLDKNDKVIGSYSVNEDGELKINIDGQIYIEAAAAAAAQANKNDEEDIDEEENDENKEKGNPEDPEGTAGNDGNEGNTQGDDGDIGDTKGDTGDKDGNDGDNGSTEGEKGDGDTGDPENAEGNTGNDNNEGNTEGDDGDIDDTEGDTGDKDGNDGDTGTTEDGDGANGDSEGTAGNDNNGGDTGGDIDNTDNDGSSDGDEGTTNSEGTDEGPIAKLKSGTGKLIASLGGSLSGVFALAEDEGSMVFYGTIEVEKAEEKESLLKKMVGLLGGAGGNDLGDKLKFENINFIVNGTTYTGGETIEIDDINNVDMFISFEWKLSDNDYDEKDKADGFQLENGDYAELPLPTFLKGVATGQQPLIEESGGSTKVVGYYEFTSENKLRLTFGDLDTAPPEGQFEDEFLNQTNRYGNVGITLNLNSAEFNNNHEQTVYFESPIDKTFTFKVKPDDTKVTAISKRGEPNQSTNPTSIIWEVEVNTKLANIEEAIIKDTIPVGLAFVGAIEVYNLAVGINGVTTRAATPFKTLPGSISGHELKIELGKLDGEAVLVKYETSIEDYEMASGYTNKADLYDDTTELSTASANVPQQEMNASITKKAIPAEKNATSIKWEVDINKGQANLENITILDTPVSQELSVVEDSVKVYTLSLVGTTWTQGTEITTFENNFPLELGDIGTSTAYRLEFETKIDYAKYEESNLFENKVILAKDYTKTGDVETYEEIGTAKASATVYRDPIMIKEGIEVTGYEDATPKIEWTIKINQAKAAIFEALLKDNIGDGLKLLPDTIKVDGVSIKDNADAPMINQSQDHYLEIAFGDITGPHIITYQTEVIGTDTSGYNNKAILTGKGRTGVGAGGSGYVVYDIDKSALTSPQLKQNKYTKQAIGSPDYATKTLEWQITVDAMKEKITELKVEDLLDNKHLLFLADSLEVWKHSTKLTKDSDYTLTLKESSAVKGFSIEFNPSVLDTKAAYIIKYKTSFDPDAVVAADGTPKPGSTPSYTNKVNITGQKVNPITNASSPINETLTATHGVKQDVQNLGKKEGSLDRDYRTMTWGIYVNVHGRDLLDNTNGVTINDTWSAGQELVADSLFVQTFTLPADGKLEPPSAGTKIEQANFGTNDITYTSKTNGFDLKFDKGINTAYYIQYQTKAVGISQEKYTNTATVKDKHNTTGSSYPAEVNFPNYDEFINKTALSGVDGSKAYKDDEIVWSVMVNESLSEIEDAKFVDTISAGHILLKDSIKVYPVDNDGKDGTELTNDTHYTVDISPYEANEPQILTINLGKKSENKIDSTYRIEYITAVIQTAGQKIKNTALLKGKDSFSQGDKDGFKEYTVGIKSWGTGTGTSPYTGAIKLEKTDNGTAKDKVVGAKFHLSYLLNGEKIDVTDEKGDNIEFKTNSEGILTIGNLPKGRQYTLEEIEAPDGYEMIANPTVTQTISAAIVHELTMVNNKLRNITVEKYWIGPGKTKTWPTSLTDKKVDFTLYANGTKLEGKTFEMGKETIDSTYTWTDLPFYDTSGAEINYTVEETAIPNYDLIDGAATTTSDSHGNKTLTFKNWNKNDKVSVKVTKEWRKESETPTKDVTINLLADGTKEQSVILNGAETQAWEHTWTDLIKYNSNGNAIKYTVAEDDITGFLKYAPDKISETETSIEYSVTNVELMDIDVEKIWAGGNDKATVTSIPIQLKGGSTEKTADITSTTWKYTFKDIPKYEKNGTKIIYNITETANTSKYNLYGITGNQTSGFEITNIPLTNITVNKEWIGPLESGDENKIKIQLYKSVDGGAETFVEEKTIANTEPTPYVFTNKPLYEYVTSEFKPVTYSIKEDIPTGLKGSYEVLAITGTSSPFTIKNKNITTIDIKVTKEWWKDATSAYEDVIIKLLAGGVEKGTQELKATDNNWEHTFTGLPKYDIEGSTPTGNEINYTINEVSVGGFVTNITGNKKDGFVVTNIETMDIKVNKEWIIRSTTSKPDVTIELLADEVAVHGKTLTLNGTEIPGWEGKFTNLPKYKAKDTPITYTVKEAEIDGYKSEVNGNQTDGFTIKNRELVDITGTKAWVDGENARPAAVNLQLSRKIGEGASENVGDAVPVNSGKSWKHTWSGLYATNEYGNVYTYTVDEVAVPDNFTKAVTGTMSSGFTITNTYKSPQITITATKQWVGGSSPKPTVWFKLYRAVGSDAPTEVTPVVIKELAPDTTSVTWTEQDETDAQGNKYTYSVKEVDETGNDVTWQPENYIKTENGLKVTNTYSSPTSASLKAIKEWDGGPSPKPTVCFKLYRQIEGGTVQEVTTSEVIEPIKALADGTTEVVWAGLTKTDTDGKEYIYSVKEVDAAGNSFVPATYTVSYAHNTDKSEQTVTNTYVSPKIFITLTKSWNNGPKPEVNIKVYRDSVYYVTVTLKSPGWTYNLEVDKTDKDGNDYLYTVEEVNVPNYNSSPVAGDQASGFTFENTYVIPKTSITARKDWVGGAPLSPAIELLLYRDGSPVDGAGSKITLDGSETTPWTYIWENLDKTDIDGKEYKYTVDEVKVPSGYNKSIEVKGGVIVITNTKRPSGGGGGGGYTPPVTPEDPKDEDKDKEKDPEKEKDPDKEKDPEKKDEPKDEPKDGPKDGPKDEKPVEEPKDPGTGKPEDPFKEKTDEETPKEGKVEVPEKSTAKVGEEPKNGKVTVDETGKWVYTPREGFVGKDSFTVIVINEDGNEMEIYFEMEVDEVPLGTAKLPKTGADSYLGYYLLGFGMILLGLGIRRKYS